ncbi:MAG: hypothetical protein AB7N65_26205 [Vicinamibacterales bacterium]
MKQAAVALLVASIGMAPSGAEAQRSAQSVPTFSKDVAPIFYQHCTTCHRPGEIGPMSLVTYKDARPYVRAIADRVSRGNMPPWHADPAHGEFLNDRRLSSDEKSTILAWVKGGAPEGRAADLPSPPSYPGGWQIGQPDAVFELPDDYPVPASGTIDYKYFEVPTHLTEDRWIQAFQVRPGDPSVVHHVIVFAKPPRRNQPPAPTGTTGQERATPPARRQGPFTFAPNMEEPPEVEAAAARQETPNDRPAPKGGSVRSWAPLPLGRQYGCSSPGVR